MNLLTCSFHIKCLCQFCYKFPHSFQEKEKKKWGNSILMERTISFCQRTTSYEVQLQYLPFQPEYNVKVLFFSFMQF